jgi:hypothetical protein
MAPFRIEHIRRLQSPHRPRSPSPIPSIPTRIYRWEMGSAPETSSLPPVFSVPFQVSPVSAPAVNGTYPTFLPSQLLDSSAIFLRRKRTSPQGNSNLCSSVHHPSSATEIGDSSDFLTHFAKPCWFRSVWPLFSKITQTCWDSHRSRHLKPLRSSRLSCYRGCWRGDATRMQWSRVDLSPVLHDLLMCCNALTGTPSTFRKTLAHTSATHPLHSARFMRRDIRECTRVLLCRPFRHLLQACNIAGSSPLIHSSLQFIFINKLNPFLLPVKAGYHWLR